MSSKSNKNKSTDDVKDEQAVLQWHWRVGTRKKCRTQSGRCFTQWDSEGPCSMVTDKELSSTATQVQHVLVKVNVSL